MIIQALTILYKNNDYNRDGDLKKAYLIAAAADILVGGLILTIGAAADVDACTAIGSLYVAASGILAFYLYKSNKQKALS